MTKFKATDEEFKNAVTSSTSKRQAIQKLGLAPKGGNYKTFDNRCLRLGISTSHFKGQAWAKNKTLPPKANLEEYLSNSKPIHSNRLKKLLIKKNIFPKICFNCKSTHWLNNEIPLELDHIDGNSLNNTLLNLRLLCPNCHALTSNYRGKNINKS